MSVPVRGQIKADREGRFTEKLAAEIGARLIALEKAIRGASPDVFTSPSVPSFGSGSSGGSSSGGGGGSSSTPGVTDHGALTGLDDAADHPQYVEQLEPAVPRPHTHGPDDVLLLDQRFYRRGEPARPAPHPHRPEDVVGLDALLARPRTITAHAHVMADVADLRPDDAQFVLAGRIYGG